MPPQVGLDESAKRQFWKNLDGLIRAVPSSEKLFIRDLNGYVGTTSVGFEAVHGGFGMVVGIRRRRKFWTSR